MAQAQFPEPPELELDHDAKVGDGRPKTFGQYSVGNPHPGFGKDPNILNELGHTKYPMWIDSKITGQREIVNNPMEEAQHTGASVAEVTAPKATPAKSPWG